MNALKIVFNAVVDHTRNTGMWILNNSQQHDKEGIEAQRSSLIGKLDLAGHSNGLA